MRHLILLRHGKTERGDDDFVRPLTARGRRDAGRIGSYLLSQSLVPDWIISSTADRARQMTILACAAMAVDTESTVFWQPELYQATPDILLDNIRSALADCRCLMLVGHNPPMEQLVSMLAGGVMPMSTGTAAIFRVPVAWSDFVQGQATLLDIIEPGELTAPDD